MRMKIVMRVRMMRVKMRVMWRWAIQHHVHRLDGVDNGRGGRGKGVDLID
jgi:hypothetical protein